MKDITQIRKLSLWIFIVPFIGVNLCLLISVNYSIFENTIFIVDQIGRSKFTILTSMEVYQLVEHLELTLSI